MHIKSFLNELQNYRITVIHVDALLKYNKYGSNVFVVGFLMIYPCRCDLTEYMYVYSAHCLLYSLSMYCLYVNCFCLEHALKNFSPRHMCCGHVTIKVI